MARPSRESTTLQFQCPLVSRNVQIDLEHRILSDRSGRVVSRVIAKTSCSDMNNCPVATHHAMSSSYDWSKCAFVKKESEN